MAGVLEVGRRRNVSEKPLNSGLDNSNLSRLSNYLLQRRMLAGMPRAREAKVIVDQLG